MGSVRGCRGQVRGYVGNFHEKIKVTNLLVRILLLRKLLLCFHENDRWICFAEKSEFGTKVNNYFEIKDFFAQKHNDEIKK